LGALAEKSVSKLLNILSEEGVRVFLERFDLKIQSKGRPISSEVRNILKARKPEIVNTLQIEETAKFYQKQGWIQIYSGHLNTNLYLVRNNQIKVPDPSLPKYTEKEILKLSELTLDELKTLHEAKVIFKGKIL
jgi:hypothetical protein